VPVRRWCFVGLVVAALLMGGIPAVPAHAVPDGSADVGLTASASGPAVPGQPLTWTLTATNHGPSVAGSVTVTQTVPLAPGDLVTSAISSVGPCTVRPPGTVTCDLGKLDDGATVRITVGQALAADHTGPASTSAVVASATADPATGDNSVTASAAPHPVADLWLSGTVTGPDTLLGGGPPMVSLLLTNNGPGVIPAGTRAQVTLPAPVDFDPAGSSPGCTAAGPVVTCVLAKPLGIGPSSATALLIRGTAAPATALGYPATAEVPAGITDSDPTNNRATLASRGTGSPNPGSGSPNPGSGLVNPGSGLVNPGSAPADLAIVASGPTGPVGAGTTVSVTYTVTNRGPADAAGVTVTATLPAGIEFDSSATGCSAAGQAVTCPTVASLASGVAVAMVVTLAVGAEHPAGTVLHPARVSVAGLDDPGANRVAYLPIAITRRANLALSASRAAGSLSAGEPVSYDLTVHNFGPATATGVLVTDRLPVEVTPGSATVPGGTCTVAGELHTCTLTDPLAVDASAVIRITGTVSTAVAGATLTDAAFASGLEPEPDSTDNGASSTGVVVGGVINSVSAEQATDGSPVHRLVALVAGLTWWSWAGGGTILFGLILLAFALRRSATPKPDR